MKILCTYLDIPPQSVAGLIKTGYQKAYSSDFVRKIGETFATRVLLIGIGLVTTMVVARILGPEGRGFYAVAITVGAMGVQFGNLGLHSSNTYFVAKNQELLPSLLGNTLAVSFGLGTLGATASWLVFYLWPTIAPLQGVLLFWALAWIPFGLAYLLLQNLLLGVHEIRFFNLLELISKIIGVALIGLIILWGHVNERTVFLTGFGTVIIGIFLAFHRLRKNHLQRPTISIAIFKENLSYGLKAYLASLFAFLLQRSGLMMVQYLLGPKQTGYYSIALSMSDLIYMLPATVGIILFPKLSALPTFTQKWTLTKKTSAVVGFTMIGTTIMAFFFSKFAVKCLFGSAFLHGVPAFIILTTSIIFSGVNNIVSNFLASVGFPWFSIYIWIIGLLINVAFNLYLIPLYGISGAAISSLICFFLLMIFQFIYVFSIKGNALEGRT